VAANPLAMTGAFTGRMVSLDPVLGSSLGEARRTGSIAARVSRQLTPRFSAELSVDYGLARLEITPASRQLIDATRASFIAAFNGLITSNPGRTGAPNLNLHAAADGAGTRWEAPVAAPVHGNWR
jgi:hypothetical protein